MLKSVPSTESSKLNHKRSTWKSLITFWLPLTSLCFSIEQSWSRELYASCSTTWFHTSRLRTCQPCSYRLSSSATNHSERSHRKWSMPPQEGFFHVWTSKSWGCLSKTMRSLYWRKLCCQSFPSTQGNGASTHSMSSSTLSWASRTKLFKTLKRQELPKVKRSLI